MSYIAFDLDALNRAPAAARAAGVGRVQPHPHWLDRADAGFLLGCVMSPFDLNISRRGRRISVGVFNDNGPEFMFTIGEESDWESCIEPEVRQACLGPTQCQLLVAFWQSGRRSIRLREQNVNSQSTLIVARHSSGDGFRVSASESYHEDGGDSTQSFDLTAREMRRIIKKALLFCWVLRNLKADQRRLAAVRAEMKKAQVKSRKLEAEELRLLKSMDRLLAEAR